MYVFCRFATLSSQCVCVYEFFRGVLACVCVKSIINLLLASNRYVMVCCSHKLSDKKLHKMMFQRHQNSSEVIKCETRTNT